MSVPWRPYAHISRYRHRSDAQYQDHSGTVDAGTYFLTKPFTLEELAGKLLDVRRRKTDRSIGGLSGGGTMRGCGRAIRSARIYTSDTVNEEIGRASCRERVCQYV